MITIGTDIGIPDMLPKHPHRLALKQMRGFGGTNHNHMYCNFCNTNNNQKACEHYAKGELHALKIEELNRYYRLGGPNGPTGHGDDCMSDADTGL
jgi:hypothetical protein